MSAFDKFEQWQNAIRAKTFRRDSSKVSRIHASFCDIFQQILVSLSHQNSASRPLLRRLERCRHTLMLWASGFGVEDDNFALCMQKSRRARNSTLRSLSSICGTLHQRTS
ncbi:hypothetical protein HD806DRAFT_43013 [Xylariaceae sp. AK1471]|nr:hypothetical protein HD806DRAFT_43013 [Xylariaceae sp. AK1471]